MLGVLRKLFGGAGQTASAPSPGPDPAQGPVSPADSPPDWRRRGNEALARGDLAAAASIYREGTQPPPGDPIAWLNLGYAQLELGEHDPARESLRQAESLMAKDDPALPDVWCLLGRERQERGEWGAAAAAYRRVVERVPTHELAWRELGQVHEVQGDFEQAQSCFLRAVALRGDFALALRDLARLMLAQHRAADALPWLDRALQVEPGHVETHVMKAHALWQLWRLPEALDAADRALALGDDPSALAMHGGVLTFLGRAGDGLASYDRALRLAPDHVLALVDSAQPLMRLHRYDEAMRRLDRALALEPDRPDALFSRGAVLMQLGRVREAIAAYDRHLGVHPREPEVAFSRAFAKLLLGDFRDGWPEYEARWELRHQGILNRKPQFGAPEWQGESLEGRAILLYAEQGLGDTIQSLRFVEAVAVQAATVWLRVQPALLPLLGTLPANCRPLPPNAGVPVDCVCPLMSLPRMLGSTLDTIPAEVPYLSAPSAAIETWRERLGERTRPRIGLTWSGNANQPNDHNRSMPLAAMLAALAPVAGDVELVSLQKEVRDSDRPALLAAKNLRHVGDELETFGDTAALMTLMDRVISVDTSVCHLAGALGRPLSIILTYAPDWRWLLEREDSPWYPTAKLYRQRVPGEWRDPLDRAVADLRSPASA